MTKAMATEQEREIERERENVVRLWMVKFYIMMLVRSQLFD